MYCGWFDLNICDYRFELKEWNIPVGDGYQNSETMCVVAIEALELFFGHNLDEVTALAAAEEAAAVWLVPGDAVLLEWAAASQAQMSE